MSTDTTIAAIDATAFIFRVLFFGGVVAVGLTIAALWRIGSVLKRRQ